MTEKLNWIQMDKCFCSASWGKCKNTQCYRYFGEPEKKYCEENEFEHFSVSDFQNGCDSYAKQVIKEGIFADEHKKSYLYQRGKDEKYVYTVFMYDDDCCYKHPVIGLHRYRKNDMETLVKKVIIPYDEFCRCYHLITK